MVCAESGLVRTLLLDLLETAIRIGGKSRLTIVCQSGQNCVTFEIRFTERLAPSAITESQGVYWAALHRLAERNQIQLQPGTLGQDGSSLRLVLPLRRADL